MTALGTVLGATAIVELVASPLGLNVIATTCLGIQWLAFIPAYLWRTERYYDLTGSLTFITAMVLSLHPAVSDNRQKMGTMMVLAWTFRLGYYLFVRILQHGKDSRFDQVKHKPELFLQYWTIQGLWVFITSLPVLILNTKKADAGLYPWPSPLDFAGVAIWLLGFVIEVLADFQKHCFQNNSETRGKWINTGLWRYSRHPNYAGEITLWVGVFLLASSSFDRWWDGLAILSPIFVTLLLSQISLPMVEKGPNKKWADEKGYKEYIQKTPAIFPFWP